MHDDVREFGRRKVFGGAYAALFHVFGPTAQVVVCLCNPIESKLQRLEAASLHRAAPQHRAHDALGPCQRRDRPIAVIPRLLKLWCDFVEAGGINSAVYFSKLGADDNLNRCADRPTC